MQENNCQTFMLLYFLCKVVGKVALKKENVPHKSQTCIAHGLCLMFYLVIELHTTSVTFLLRFPPHIRCAVKL